MIIKLGNIELSEWEKFGITYKYNYYRQGIVPIKKYPNTFSIGLILYQDGSVFNNNLSICHWSFNQIGGELIPDFAPIMSAHFKNKIYYYDQIPQAKKEIDHFIIKLSKLKSFL